MQSNGYMNNTQIQPQVQSSQLKQSRPVQNTMQAQPASTPVQAPVQNTAAYYPQARPQVPPIVPSSASGVNIQIISPSVYGNNGTSSMYPPYNPIYNYPPANNINNNFAPVNNVMGQQPVQPAPAPAPKPAPAPEPKKEEPPKTEKKDIVPLTNEYIMTLENYLNNPNKQTRQMGIKQVLKRFKEDESRKYDAALTALMNKALQDKSTEVRTIAMLAPASGYAAGDAKTVALLKRIQQSTANYNEDSLLASQALMKIAEGANKVEIEVPKEEKKDR